MRFAIDGSVLEPPCPTGVERAAAAIVRALPAVIVPGDEVFVLTRVPLLRGPLGATHARVHFVALDGPEAPLLWRESHLAPALAELGIDVLWSPVTAIPLRTTVPRVATFHEAPWLVQPGMEGLFREHAHRLRLAIAAQTAARIVCPSEASRGQFVQIHPGSAPLVRVVPHGVDERFLAPRDDAAAAARRERLGAPLRYLLHVGGNRPRKNVPLLLAAFSRYRLRGGRADLVLAGPGAPPDRLPRSVLALGWVDDDALLALYDGATALVITSDSEGFGLPVLEAFARGVPVAATAAGGVVEAAGGAGPESAALFAPTGDAEALASALVRLDGDAALRALLVDRGRRRARACRWEDSAQNLLEVLREAVPCR